MKKRKSVLWFANQMESVLQENDNKDGWDDCSVHWLLARLTHEVAELQEVFAGGDLDYVSHERVIEEAVDVANYAMMIADIIKKIPRPQKRDSVTGLIDSIRVS